MVYSLSRSMEIKKYSSIGAAWKADPLHVFSEDTIGGGKRIRFLANSESSVRYYTPVTNGWKLLEMVGSWIFKYKDENLIYQGLGFRLTFEDPLGELRELDDVGVIEAIQTLNILGKFSNWKEYDQNDLIDRLRRENDLLKQKIKTLEHKDNDHTSQR